MMTPKRNIAWLIMPALLLAQSCSDGIGEDEDSTAPEVTVTAPVEREEISGTYTITWKTDEPNRSSVDIALSTNSGKNYNTEIVTGLGDEGRYEWNTNDVADCRQCRIRIVARDVVGNVSEPAESDEDFIVNNVPNVQGRALYYDDLMEPGPSNGDRVVIPFDKDIDIRSPLGRDLQLPVSGDTFGDSATVTLGEKANELIINMDSSISGDKPRLHVNDTFSPDRTIMTAPSGVDVIAALPPRTIFAPDTGRTAQPSQAVDIAPTFGATTEKFKYDTQVDPESDDDQSVVTVDTVAAAFGNLNDDAYLDAVLVENGTSSESSVYMGDSKGEFIAKLGYVPGYEDNTSVALGDIDGDEKTDIVIGNTGGSMYFINDGEGGFGDAVQMNENGSTVAVVLGDINGDSLLDLILGNCDGPNSIILNSDAVVFGGGVWTFGDSGTLSLALGDVDFDGDLDMVEGKEAGKSSRVYLNDKASFFGNVQPLGGSVGDTNAIGLGDIDNDGDIDIFEANGSSSPNRVFINDGKAVFEDFGQRMGRNNSRSADIGDYDGDGDIDVVVGNHGQPSRVWTNDGAGVFADSGQALEVASISASTVVRFLDVDGDTDLDIFEGVISRDKDIVWLNSARSMMKYIDSGHSFGSGGASSVAVGLVNDDPYLDFVVGKNGETDVDEVWFNAVSTEEMGSAKFIQAAQPFSPGSLTNAVALGDLNGDGFSDLITGSEYDDIVWINDGEGLFYDSRNSLNAGRTGALSIADVDGFDGPDIVVGGSLGENSIHINTRDGEFVKSNIELGAGRTSSVITENLDGVNGVDIVFSDSLGPTLLWLDNGNGGFRQEENALGSNVWTMDVGDVNGDGKPDIVTAGNEPVISLWINSGSRPISFLRKEIGKNEGGYETGALLLVDIDNDGDLDILVGNSGAPNSFHLNRGNGAFIAGTSIMETVESSNMVTTDLGLGDIDQDGDIDFVEARRAQGVRVWLNDS